jgi:hypothetical protein
VKLTTHLHLVPRSNNEWNYTSTPQYAFIAWCSDKKHRENFTFLIFLVTFSLGQSAATAKNKNSSLLTQKHDLSLSSGTEQTVQSSKALNFQEILFIFCIYGGHLKSSWADGSAPLLSLSLHNSCALRSPRTFQMALVVAPPS